MSYIVSEVYEAFIAASDLRRAPGGVRFIAVVTVVLLASLLTAADEGQSGAQQPSAQAGGESPGTGRPEDRGAAGRKGAANARATEGELPAPECVAGSRRRSSAGEGRGYRGRAGDGGHPGRRHASSPGAHPGPGTPPL